MEGQVREEAEFEEFRADEADVDLVKVSGMARITNAANRVCRTYGSNSPVEDADQHLYRR